MVPIECSECHSKFHKTTCTVKTRWVIEKIVAENRDWNCNDCKVGRPPPQVQKPQAAPVPPGKCQGKECATQIRKGVDFIICAKCKGHFHKQQRCSEMTRKQVENLDFSTSLLRNALAASRTKRIHDQQVIIRIKGLNTPTERLS